MSLGTVVNEATVKGPLSCFFFVAFFCNSLKDVAVRVAVFRTWPRSRGYYGYTAFPRGSLPRRRAWPQAEVETTRKTSPWSSSSSPLSSMSSSSPSWISSSSSTIRRVFVKVGDLKVAASRKEGTCLKRSALSPMLFFVVFFARGVVLLCACAQSWIDTPSREAARLGGGAGFRWKL